MFRVQLSALEQLGVEINDYLRALENHKGLFFSKEDTVKKVLALYAESTDPKVDKILYHILQGNALFNIVYNKVKSEMKFGNKSKFLAALAERKVGNRG